MNIAEILTARAKAHPLMPALIDPRRKDPVSFGDLETTSARAAGLLWREGLRPGDAVLVFLPMSTELYVTLLAIFRLNLVAVFVDPFAGLEHIERCCRLYSPRGVIGPSKWLVAGFASAAIRHIPIKIAVGFTIPRTVSWGEISTSSPHGILRSNADTPAVVTFTSGSTGTPKGIVRNHGFLLAQHRVIEKCLDLKPGERVFTTLPVFVLSHLASGITSVLPNSSLRSLDRMKPGQLVAQLNTSVVTAIEGSPTFLEQLVHHCLVRNLVLGNLRKIFLGGGPVFPQLVSRVQKIAPQAVIHVVYGSSEAEPIAHIDCSGIRSEDIQATAEGGGLLVGPPIAAIGLRILPDRWGRPIGPYSSEAFEADGVPAGEVGEIVVHGGHVLESYLDGSDEKLTKFRVGNTTWHRTGDAGYLDPQGRLWLLGPCSARIRGPHGNLYPLAVEGAVLSDPNVRRAACVAHAGSRVLAIESRHRRYVPNVERLRRQLAWAHIDEVRLLSRIPTDKRHRAKIDYRATSEVLDSETLVRATWRHLSPPFRQLRTLR